MAPPLRLLRLANPLVSAVLRSPAHRVLSGALVLLDRPGGRAAIPVLGADTPEGVVVVAVAPAGKRWWRAYASPAPATLTVRGARCAATGALLEGAARREALRAYLTRFPRTRGPLALEPDPSDDALDAADVAVVRFCREG